MRAFARPQDDGHAHRDAAHLERQLAQPVGPAGFGEVVVLERLAAQLLHRVAKHRLAHAARRAEDHPGARAEAKGHVERLGRELGEVEPRLLDHAPHALRGDHVVDVGPAVRAELVQLRLGLLGRAGHHRDDDQVVGIDPERLGQHLAGHRAEHLLRRAAGAEVVGKLRVVQLDELHPRRAARGEERQVLARRLAADELLCLLDDGQVGGEAGVVHLVETHGLERGDGLGRGRLARVHPEDFAQARAHRGSHLRHHGLVGVVERRPDVFHLAGGNQRPGGADRRALAAADALDLVEVAPERRGHHAVGAAAAEVDRAHAHDLVAGPHAVAAQDALVGVAHDGRGGTCPWA